MFTTKLYHNGVEYEWGEETTHIYYTPTVNTILYIPGDTATGVAKKGGSGTITNRGVTINSTITKKGALEFNGGSNYITTSAITPTNFTFIARIYNTLGSGANYIFYSTYHGGYRYNNNLDFSNSYPVSSSGTTAFRTASGKAVNDKRILYSYIKSGSSYYSYSYIDGTLYSGSAGGYNNTNSMNIWIGRDGSLVNYFSGYMGDIAIENKARTAQEVLAYYNLTKSNYGL